MLRGWVGSAESTGVSGSTGHDNDIFAHAKLRNFIKYVHLYKPRLRCAGMWWRGSCHRKGMCKSTHGGPCPDAECRSICSTNYVEISTATWAPVRSMKKSPNISACAHRSILREPLSRRGYTFPFALSPPSVSSASPSSQISCPSPSFTIKLINKPTMATLLRPHHTAPIMPLSKPTP